MERLEFITQSVIPRGAQGRGFYSLIGNWNWLAGNQDLEFTQSVILR